MSVLTSLRIKVRQPQDVKIFIDRLISAITKLSIKAPDIDMSEASPGLAYLCAHVCTHETKDEGFSILKSFRASLGSPVLFACSYLHVYSCNQGPNIWSKHISQALLRFCTPSIDSYLHSPSRDQRAQPLWSYKPLSSLTSIHALIYEVIRRMM